jgi:UDP-perosamine 4-acetyltransferase
MTPEGIVVIGAGGHAKVCIELLRAMGEPVDWCVGGEDGPDTCVGVPVLRGDVHLARLRDEGYHRVFVALGSNSLRERLADDVVKLDFTLVSAISPTSEISPSARIGVGVAIMSGVVINAESNIHDLAIINTGATIDHDCVIGRAAHIAPQSGLAGNVSVGRRSFLGIGSRAIPGVRIGEDVVVGAGAVVIRDVEDGATVVGVPAQSTVERSGT